MWLLNFPGLTWLSSHHILAPPFATLSERMKYSLQTVRRRMQVLANLAIVLIIPAGGREGKEGGRYSGDGSMHPGLCGTEKPSAFTNATRAAVETLQDLGAKESVSCHLLPGMDCDSHLPFSFLCPGKPAPAAQRGTAALQPAPSYSRLKWLRQARSTILARNRMAARALLQKAVREREASHRTAPRCRRHRSRPPDVRRDWAGSGAGGPGFLPLR